MIEKSLKLLNTDHVDLWQLHDVGLPEDVDAIFAKGGAMEALLEMQDQKVVRFLGVTGHYRPEALIDAVNRHNFDTILMAMNAADSHIHSFTDKLLAARRRKADGHHRHEGPSRGRLLSSWTPPLARAQRHSWEGSAIATRPAS
jgi:predicted aldo/keto reductase-like oxidoreductase